MLDIHPLAEDAESAGDLGMVEPTAIGSAALNRRSRSRRVLIAPQGGKQR
jgi:hypothetical protein